MTKSIENVLLLLLLATTASARGEKNNGQVLSGHMPSKLFRTQNKLCRIQKYQSTNIAIK